MKYECEWIKFAIVKWEKMKILVSEIHTFLMKTEKPKNENSQILLWLTTIRTYKNEWKIWMTVSLYFVDRKVRVNEF